MIQKIKTFIVGHKIISGAIALILIISSYFMFKSNATAEVRYVTAIVEKGDIISSITGTGQVEATSTIELKAKSSGTITQVNVTAGSYVRKGQTLFVIDGSDALKGVRDAKLSLQIAESDLASAKKDYENTKVSKDTALKNLLLDLNSSVVAMPESDNVNTNIVNVSGTYTSTVQGRYTLEVYECSGGQCITYRGLESGSFAIKTNVPQKLGDRGLYVTFTSLPKTGEEWYIDLPSLASTTYAAKLRAYEEGKLSIPQDIENAEETVKSRELALVQKQNALIDAQRTLSDYYVSAPFDGTIASVTAIVGNTASDTLGTIITKQKVASITLNEVDVSKVSLGQKATLTFDAVENLTITGEVVEIDGVGTVTQGVVSYTVKISFDTDDARIKPGMSVSASVITAMKQGVLVIPASAIKTDTRGSYVEIFNPALPVGTAASAQGSLSEVLPEQVAVEVGVSDDTSTEVTTGLKEGDQVVSRTITSNTTKPSTVSTPSLFGNAGARGATRAITR